MEKHGYHWGTGRRKTAVARVRLRPNGKGDITINKRPFVEYFVRAQDQIEVKNPLSITGTSTDFDVFVNVNGGGDTGQAGAVQLGIARALVSARPDLEDSLRDEGFLTRDSRQKERKKYGKKGARASFQFSKR